MIVHLYLWLMRMRDEHKEAVIRQKAIEMIVKQGLDGFSMQKLAKAARVSPATLYIYYKDREDLILQICVQISSHLIETSLKGFDPGMDFEEGMKVQWENRAAYFIKHPLEIQFIEQIRYSPMYDKVEEVLTKRFGEIMGQFVHNAIARGQLVKLPFEVYWAVAFAPLYQLVKFHSQGKSYGNKHFVMDKKVMHQALALVLKALKA